MRESPARPSISAFVGRSRRYVMSGTTIVPPPMTRTSVPSPKAAIASSSERGMRTSVAASTAILATAITPPFSVARISAPSLIRCGWQWEAPVYAAMEELPHDRRARVRASQGRLPSGSRARDGALPRARAREAGAPRGGGRSREDGSGQGACDGARGAPDQAPVLRGPRRLARGLRVELPASAPPHPRRAGGHGVRGGALRP